MFPINYTSVKIPISPLDRKIKPVQHSDQTKDFEKELNKQLLVKPIQKDNKE